MNNSDIFYGQCIIDVGNDFSVKTISRNLIDLLATTENSTSKQKVVQDFLNHSNELKLALVSANVDMHFSMPISFNSKTGEKLNLYIQGYCNLDTNTLNRIVSLSFFNYRPVTTDSIEKNYDQDLLSSLLSINYYPDIDKCLQKIFQVAAERFNLDYMYINTFLKNTSSHRACEFFTLNRITHYYKRDVKKIVKSRLLAPRIEDLDRLNRVLINVNDKNNTDIFYIKNRNKYHINSIISFLNKNSANNDYVITFLKKDTKVLSEYEINTLENLVSILCIFYDFSRKSNRYENRIEELLSKDNTTDTYVFENFLKLSRDFVVRKKGGQFAYISFDINRFSYIISHCSEQESADFLCDVVARFRKLHHSILISRLYGDNFMAMMQIKSKEELHEKLISLANDFSSRMDSLYPNIDISLSIGVYISDINETDIKKCTENASYIHSFHKKNIKQTISYFTHADELERQDEQEISSSFKTSLKNGEYKLYLQPKYNLSTGRIVGAEALTRLEKSGVILSPYRFIPILEQTGYLTLLDLYIFEEVAKTLRKWLDLGYKVFPISINFSKQHVLSSNFVKSLVAISTSYEIPPHYFDIEITETTLAANYEYMKDCIERLKLSGFKVSMDDFGTGYSSLNMLVNTGVSTVKIDKAFVDEIDISPQKSGFLIQIANLIRFAGKEIIIEGVESELQASFLLENDITIIQGYHISKPLPLLEFETSFVKKI